MSEPSTYRPTLSDPDPNGWLDRLINAEPGSEPFGPTHEQLVELVNWMVEQNSTPEEIARAVEKPWNYRREWEAAKAGMAWEEMEEREVATETG